MADGEQSREAETSAHDLTITEDQNDSLNATNGELENGVSSEPYKYDFSLEDYYKYCLKYYHKEKKIIKMSYDDKLQLTAYWKQASSGKFDIAKFPDVGYFDVIGNDRKRAWETLGDMSKTEAMERFCILLEECSPELKPWMEAQKKEVEERLRLKREEEEKKQKVAEEAAERERLRLQAEEEERRVAEEAEMRRLEELRRQQEEQMQQQEVASQQVDGLEQAPPPPQEDKQNKAAAPLVNGTQRIAPASLWTRPKVMEFIQHVKSDPSSVLVVGRGETMTVRVPTHDSGTCLFWEFATEHYDLGFGVSFEWSQPNSKNITVAVNESDDDEFTEDSDKTPEVEASPPRPRVDEILPVVRRPCHEEVIVGSHMYPGRGVYLLKFDNSYSLFRSKTLYYRVYYTR